MTSTPDQPTPHGEDLAELREEIDELQAIPEEEMLSPTPADIAKREPTPHATDAIGSTDWDDTEDELETE